MGALNLRHEAIMPPDAGGGAARSSYGGWVEVAGPSRVPPPVPPEDAPPDAVPAGWVPVKEAPRVPLRGDGAMWVRTGGAWRHGWVHAQWKDPDSGAWTVWVQLAHTTQERLPAAWGSYIYDGVSVRRR